MTKILKGGISYTEDEIEYIWHSSDNACEKCRALNGEKYNSIAEIPDLPHPNCKCWIEDKEKEIKYESKFEEKENLLDDLDKIASDFMSLKDEIQQVIHNIEFKIYDYPDKKKILDEYMIDLKEVLNKCSYEYEKTQVNADDFSIGELEILINELSLSYQEHENQFNIINNALIEELTNFENKKKNDEIFKYDFKKHDELKQLLLHHHKNAPLPDGYKLKGVYYNDKTGLDVEIYEHKNEVILSFPGSKQIDKDFLKTDIINLSKGENPQLEDAQKVLDKVKNNPEYKNHKIITTGYSLGGNTAGGLSVMNNIEGVTFNSYGDLNKVIQNKANKLGETIKINPEKLINYRHENDVLSEKKNIGYNYDVLNYGQNAKTNIFGSHDIKNTGQTINRKPNVNVYHEKTIYYPKINLQQKQLKEQEVVVKSPIDINITE